MRRARAVIAKGFRSGLEDTLAAQVAAAGHQVRYEERKLPYIRPASTHRYTPDFVLDNGIIIESKGIFTPEDRKKHLLVRAAHPTLDIRFVFTRSSSPINKGSKTTYADWCRKNGFLFADKRIPASWFEPLT